MMNRLTENEVAVLNAIVFGDDISYIPKVAQIQSHKRLKRSGLVQERGGKWYLTEEGFTRLYAQKRVEGVESWLYEGVIG